MHAAEMVESRIRRAILVTERIFAGNRHDSSDRPIVLVRQPNFQSLPEGVHQVSEPNLGLRGQLVPAPRQKEETVKLIQELLRRAFPIGQALALSTANLSLDRTLVQVFE